MQEGNDNARSLNHPKTTAPSSTSQCSGQLKLKIIVGGSLYSELNNATLEQDEESSNKKPDANISEAHSSNNIVDNLSSQDSCDITTPLLSIECCENKMPRASKKDDQLSEDDRSLCEKGVHSRILKGDVYKRDLLEFSVDPIRHLFECSLCKGFYREPYTITKQCLHSFCKSCLVSAICSQNEDFTGNGCPGWCPNCRDYLGKDWRKSVLPDHALQHLMDKVLFADMAAADAQDEAAFYQQQGIPRKPEKNSQAESSNPIDNNKRKQPNNNDTTIPTTSSKTTTHRPTKMVHVHLIPFWSGTTKTEPLEYPYLEVPDNIRILELKKYLALKKKVLRGEMFCNGSALGNEWTIEFIQRTLWMPSEEESNILTLEFR